MFMFGIGWGKAGNTTIYVVGVHQLWIVVLVVGYSLVGLSVTCERIQ